MYDIERHAESIKNPSINDACICQNTHDTPYIITNENSPYKNPKKKYKVIDGKFAGGTYVLFPNDIAFAWYTSESLLSDIVVELFRFLQSENVPVYEDGNDFMVKGKKLFGTMSMEVPNGCYEGIFFCFDPDIDLIKSVCVKEMKKEPIGLTTFGIKPEMIITFCRQMIEKHNLNEL